jgi:hypothetical protein
MSNKIGSVETIDPFDKHPHLMTYTSVSDKIGFVETIATFDISSLHVHKDHCKIKNCKI